MFHGVHLCISDSLHQLCYLTLASDFESLGPAEEGRTIKLSVSRHVALLVVNEQAELGLGGSNDFALDFEAGIFDKEAV